MDILHRLDCERVGRAIQNLNRIGTREGTTAKRARAKHTDSVSAEETTIRDVELADEVLAFVAINVRQRITHLAGFYAGSTEFDSGRIDRAGVKSGRGKNCDWKFSRSVEINRVRIAARPDINRNGQMLILDDIANNIVMTYVIVIPAEAKSEQAETQIVLLVILNAPRTTIVRLAVKPVRISAAAVISGNGTLIVNPEPASARCGLVRQLKTASPNF